MTCMRCGSDDLDTRVISGGEVVSRECKSCEFHFVVLGVEEDGFSGMGGFWGEAYSPSSSGCPWGTFPVFGEEIVE